MTLTVTIPDNLAASIGGAVDEVRSRFIECYAVQAYRSGTFSTAEVRELLDFERTVLKLTQETNFRVSPTVIEAIRSQL